MIKGNGRNMELTFTHKFVLVVKNKAPSPPVKLCTTGRVSWSAPPDASCLSASTNSYVSVPYNPFESHSQTHIHAYIHTCIHAYMDTWIHGHMHTYMCRHFFRSMRARLSRNLPIWLNENSCLQRWFGFEQVLCFPTWSLGNFRNPKPEP